MSEGTHAAYAAAYEALAVEDRAVPLIDPAYLDRAAQRFLARIGPVLSKRVCDLGCGRGILAQRMSEAGAYVTAVDISPSHLRALPERSRLSPLLADIDDLPSHLAGRFDIVTATDVMEHTLRPGGFLLSLNRIIKSGGLAYLRVPYRENLLAYAPDRCHYEYAHLRSYNKKLLRDTLSGVGFQVERFWLDGFSPQTPQRWWLCTTGRPNRRSGWFMMSYDRGLRYNLWAAGLTARGRDVDHWPTWCAWLLMRPVEIIVRARKVRELES